MKKIIKQGAKLEKFTLPREDAIKYMEDRNEPYKVELIKDLPEDSIISFYSQGEFVDLCAGPHLMSTSPIKAFKLISSSMAYWRGDANKARLQRIYGTAERQAPDDHRAADKLLRRLGIHKNKNSTYGKIRFI